MTRGRDLGARESGPSALRSGGGSKYDETMPDSSSKPPSGPGGDLARRVAHRRAELGLTAEELAQRAGIDPGYLRYFETSPQATLSAGTLQLIALALDTTPLALLGGEVDRPPGHGRAGRHPVLRPLTSEQCKTHLAGGGVGRLVYSDRRGPVALPVNFEYTQGEVVFSTDETKAIAVEARSVVGFEVDRVDDAMSEGWSVIVTGRARQITDSGERQRLASLDLVAWTGDDRHSLVALKPDAITGRVIIHESAADQG
jgi:transcriptional regulator with XRE-family HTH domain